MSSVDEQLVTLRQQFEKHDQHGVFRHFDKKELTEEEKEALLTTLKAVDLEDFSKSVKQALSPVSETKITPFEGVAVKVSGSKQAEEWKKTGLALIAHNKVCAILMAGGQGTRLGSDAPKGCYDIKLPSSKSMFQLLSEKLTRVKQIAAQQETKDAAKLSLPWYIMTSPQTHEPTVEFFKANNNFGYPKGDVHFFPQALIPCITLDGHMFLDSKTTLATNPNGNGGIYKALLTGGILADMEKRGIDHAHVFGVDNVLVKAADPTFVGYCASEKAEAGNKVVLKTDPHEKVGVMALVDGMPGVVEYSDISSQQAESRGKDGKLLYSAGNIAQHYFSREFLKRVANSRLPFHKALKKIPFLNEKGEVENPAKENGIKMEMFIFDSFGLTKRVACLAVDRPEEFTAVKNPPGTATDSPDSARRDISLFWARLIKNAGGKIEGDVEKEVLEVSPTISYEGEGLEALVKDKVYKLPAHITGDA